LLRAVLDAFKERLLLNRHHVLGIRSEANRRKKPTANAQP